MKIDPETLRTLVRYEPETGKLFWLPRHGNASFNTAWAGKEAFTFVRSDGYRVGSLFNLGYYSHRVVWAIVYGEWPEGQIDHINGVRSDNRFTNLRSVSSFENKRNIKRPVHNTSGTIGVAWEKGTKRWRARIVVDGVRINLGNFDTVEDAAAARKEAEAKHGYHPNHGRVAA
jgi:hypothetical protein